MSRPIQDFYLQQSSHHQRHQVSTDLPDKNTTDYWRHQRMYELIQPFLQNKKFKWLTIGDGRFGKDAEYISKAGIDVLATDLDVTLLKQAKQTGFIKKYKRENAEKLSFRDNLFDYIFCKESYHHFPRPAIALYEMIRVCRQAAIVIEPNDVEITKSPLLLIKNLKAIFSPEKKFSDRFETAGNYVYTVSVREFEKAALGLGLPAIAYRGIDDHYLPGVETEINISSSPLKKKIVFRLKIAQILNWLHLRQPSLLAIIIFKSTPTTAMIKRLAQAGYVFKPLPINPYLKNS